MKKFILLILITFSFSKIIDETYILVNDKPITTYQIQKLSKKLNIPKKQAINILINKILQQQEIQKRGISVDEYDVYQEIENIAAQNHMNSWEFRNILEQKGINFNEFKNNIKQKLLIQKLYNQIALPQISISDEELKNYYNTHKNEFTIYKKFDVDIYKDKRIETLQEMIKNPLFIPNSVIKEHKILDAQNISPKIMQLLLQTPINNFTPIIQGEFYFETFFINNKLDKTIMPFDKVKNYIYNKLFEIQKEKIVANYFKKLRQKAVIKILN